MQTSGPSRQWQRCWRDASRRYISSCETWCGCRESRSHLLTEHGPGDIRAQFLAGNHLVFGARLALNGRAMLGRHPVAKPRLHGLMTLVLHLKQARRVDGAAENANCPLRC